MLPVTFSHNLAMFHHLSSPNTKARPPRRPSPPHRTWAVFSISAMSAASSRSWLGVRILDGGRRGSVPSDVDRNE